jgi:hypothetical protein
MASPATGDSRALHSAELTTELPDNQAVEESPSGAQAPDLASGGVSVTWRAVVLITLLCLLAGMRPVWNAIIWHHSYMTLALLAGYAAIFGCAILAVVLRVPAAMRRLEYGVLALALWLYASSLPRWFRPGTTSYANDEGPLTDLAGTALRSGRDPYARSWPRAFVGWRDGMTQTMSGHVVRRFDYPPVAAILDALAKPVTHGLPTAGVVAALALLVLTVLTFFLLPSPWRTAAPLVCIGLGIYLPVARLGYPTVIALPLLVLAVNRWTSVGAGGRLGRLGWAGAIGLGLAAATEQVTWFFAPFLIVAIVLVRRGELPWRATVRVCGYYVGIAIAAFGIVNLPFAAWNFRDWLEGVIAPMTQGAVPHGQGLVDVSLYLLRGSGAMNFYSYGALAYGIALLFGFTLYLRRLGAAVAILPWTIFLFSVRSQDGYFLLPAVLWVVSVLTGDRSVIERAHDLAGPLRRVLPGGRLFGTRAPAAVLAAAFLPAVACLAVAVGTPPPLRLTVSVPAAGGSGTHVSSLTVAVTNGSGHDVSPHFALSSGVSITAYWIITSGPTTLRPGATARYVITAPWRSAAPSRAAKLLELRAYSGGPATLSSAVISRG